MKQVGSFALSGRLTDREGRFGLDEIHAQSRGDGPFDLEIIGSLRDLHDIRDIDLKMDLDAKDANLFEQWTTS